MFMLYFGAELFSAACSRMAKPSPPLDFETALGELERIVAAMETGQMPLEESLNAYQRGVALLRQCNDTLTAAEQRVQVLEQGMLSDFNEGNLPSGPTGA
jgi:exodeoxyribonuclease VII small subunit